MYHHIWMVNRLTLALCPKKTENTTVQHINTDSKIYKWDGTVFAEVQNIPTSGANNKEFYERIGRDSQCQKTNKA